MSGPKCSQVRAALDVVKRSSQRCRGRLAESDARALESLLETARKEAVEARKECSAVEREMKRRSDVLAKAPASAKRAAQELASASGLEQAVVSACDEAKALLDHARKLERGAVSRAEQGQAEYERARVAIRTSRQEHHRDQEMAWAERAQGLFEEAEQLLNQAASARAQARQKAQQSVRDALAATENARQARATTARAEAEAEAARAAAEEAQREAEAQRREAVTAVNRANEILRRIHELPLDKLRPEAPAIRSPAIEAAQQALRAGDSATAVRCAGEAERELGRMEGELARDLARRLESRAEALSALESLRASLEATDGTLIREWAADGRVLERVTESCEAAGRELEQDGDFGRALSNAREGVETLSAAEASAAESFAADERRRSVGTAVMQVLKEMGFDVSFQEGSRTEPMRIAGQTSDQGGHGDFDVSLPLDGDVDFTVETPQGDASCVAAVEELQRRLAERGIDWVTTDWGHAQPEQVPHRQQAVDRAPEREKSRTQEPHKRS